VKFILVQKIENLVEVEAETEEAALKAADGGDVELLSEVSVDYEVYDPA
jgi:hypothetical protein